MYIPREREMQLRRYGRCVRATNLPKYEPNTYTSYGGSRKANLDTPRSRNNYGTAAHKALAVATNNDWQWYGHLWMSNEPVTSFNDVHSFIKKFTKRLQKQRERSESKDLAYLIVPDVEEQGDIQKWFLHIWLMNVPNTDKVFFCDIISQDLIIYHWKKHEQHYGRSELYKIFDSGRTSNGKWKEQNAFQIFDIIERTNKYVPKTKRLYYHSDNVTIDIIIAKGKPSAVNEIPITPKSNDFVYSEWFTSSDYEENVTEASKYLLWNDPVIDEWNWGDDDEPEPEQQQEETNDNSYENNYIPPVDDYYFYSNAEYYNEPVDFDYSVLNDIYETEVYSYEQQPDDYFWGQTGQNYRPVENFDVIRYC